MEGKGNLHLARVTVLGDEIAGVAGQHEIIDLFFRALRHRDRFPDVRKMVYNRMPCGLASYLGLVDNLGKVLPFGISEKPL